MALALVRARQPSSAEPTQLRAMTALLRWRCWWLLRHLPERQALAVRLVPSLLQASFPHRELKSEAPGVIGVGPGRGWAALARAFGLPPASGSQRGPRLISALLVVPGAAQLEVLAVLEQRLGAAAQDRVRMRLEAIEALLGSEGARLKLRAISLADPATGLPLSLLPFGGQLAGRLGLPFFERLALPRPDEQRLELAALWEQAPTPLCRLALMFLSPQAGPPPFPTLWELLASHPARALADPELFCLLWVARAKGCGPQLLELAARVATSAVTRSACLRQLGQRELGPLPAQVLQTGRAVALQLASRVRRAPASAQTLRLRRALRGEVLSAGVPLVLLPALGAALRAFQPPSNERWLTEQPSDAGHPPRAIEVREPSGALLGVGATSAQAWVRALALAGRALDQPPAIPEAGPLFARLGPRLHRPPERRTVAFVVEGSQVPGPPNDPLNRGPERVLAVRATLEVILPADGRPSARRLAPYAAAGRLILAASAGRLVEVIAAETTSEAAAARLGRVAGFCRAPSGLGPQVVELQGRAVRIECGRLLQSPATAFAFRPRSFAPDPEAWDLGAAVASLRTARPGPKQIDCLVWPFDAELAVVWYSTCEGVHLQERVPWTLLEQHLADTQRLVREAQPAKVLTLRLGPEVTGKVGRFDPLSRHVVPIDLEGRLPFGLTLTLAGERFGAGTCLGYRAAAEAVLARWPPGVIGFLTVRKLELRGQGADAALLRLYARSLVLRRLWAHIRSACRPEGSRPP